MDEVPVRRVADYAAEDAWLPVRLRPILAKKLDEAELADLLSALELPLIDVLVELEYNGIKVDVARLAELSRRYGQRMETLEAGDLPTGGPAVQHRLAQAASGVAVHRVEAAGGQEDGEDRPQHRRRGAGGAGPAASAAGQDPRIPAVRQAEEHLRRCPAGDGLPGDRPGPCLVQPGGGGHRPAQFQRSEPAKHPRADRGGAGNPLGVRARPARAGCCWRPTIRRSSCGCWPISRATPGCARRSPATRTSTPGWPAK